MSKKETIVNPVCVFGLTADPMTVAHREMCRMVMDRLNPSQLYVIPTIVNYHRKGKYYWLSGDDRVNSCSAMLSTLGYGYRHKWRLLGDEIRLKQLCRRECSKALNEEVVSNRRFVHTLLDFIVHHEPIKDIVLVLGTDSYQHFTSWHRYKDILSLISGIVVFQGRDGYASHSPIEESVKVWHFDMPEELAKVSASKVRECYTAALGSLDDYLKDIREYDLGHTTLKKLGWV